MDIDYSNNISLNNFETDHLNNDDDLHHHLQQQQQQQEQQILNDFIKPDQHSVNISIEPNHEFEIQEIKYDGEEIYKEPLSQSDNLAMLISKIDFNEELNISYADDANLNNISKETIKNSTKMAQKFHRNIYDKVRHSYDEICVLLDCLQIAYVNTNLLTLENSEEDRFKHNDVNDKILNNMLKKKNIEAAKLLIKKSLEKILNDLEYTNNRFHVELYRVRQFWRIKKVANKFIGDFSYRSVGCLNALKGSFEILKNDYNKQQQIDVTIPEEYEEDAYIRVQLVSNDSKQNYDFKYSIFQFKTQILSNNFLWHRQLENAQNSIYAKELFNQILREAFELQTQLRPLIIGNSIKFSLINNFNLIISLEHNNYNNNNNFNDRKKSFNKDFNCSFLEHLLYQLLRNYFHQTFTHIDQRPVTSVVAYNFPVKLAGISYSKDYTNKRLNILQTVKEVAEHMIVRNKVLKILNDVSKEISDPLVIVEPNFLNTSTHTDIRLTILSTFYEAIPSAKFCFYVKIKNTNVSVLSLASTTTFTDNIDNLKSFILDQCCLQQMTCIQELCKIFNWSIITNGTLETPTHIYSILQIWNSLFSKKIAIKLGPVNKIEIFVKKYNDNTDSTSTNGHAIETNNNMNGVNTSFNNDFNDIDASDYGNDNCINLEWLAAIQKSYHKVNINDVYPGRTLINKFELFLADMAFN